MYIYYNQMTQCRNEKDPSLNALALLNLLDDQELAPYMELLPKEGSPDIVRS